MNSNGPRTFHVPNVSQIRVAAQSITAAGLMVCLAQALGCAMAAPPAGVTPGGQQDIASARNIIANGGIPDPDSITVEGFLSEHTIPIDVPDDAGLLYATASASWHRDFDAFTPLATVQIGFGTTVDAETFQRDALNLVLVIDRSGSMEGFIDERSGTTKLDAVKIAIDRLLGQLSADDQVSIVTFNSEPKTWLHAAAGNDIAAIKSALDEITATGGTDLEAGMRRGYRVATEHSDDIRSDRLIVFTDALLTSSLERDAIEFISVMEQYADNNIGATVFGVGVDFGHEVTNQISQVRGGNYFFLNTYDRIVSVFDEEFDFLVTPVAYDVALEVSVPFIFDVVDVHGVEVDEPIPHVVELSIPTLFLSSRQGGGAVFVRVRAGSLVDFDRENVLAEVSLSYTSHDGETVTLPTVTTILPAGLQPNADESYFASDAAKRGVLLLNTALVLISSCEDAYYYYDYWYPYYGGRDSQRAIQRLTEFLPYFDDLSLGLENQASPTSRTLSEERALLSQLLQNIKN